MTKQQAREAALQGPIAELRDVLISWRECSDDALRHLGGLEEYPSAKPYLTALEGVRAALEGVGQPLPEVVVSADRQSLPV